MIDSVSDATLAAYARVLDALPMVAWIADPSGAIVYISPPWELYTGIRASDLYRLGYAHFVHPDDLSRVAGTWDAARNASGAYRDELRLRFGDGSFRWVVSEANPVRDERGSVAGWLGTVTDVHDRRVAEHELEERGRLQQQTDEGQRLLAESIPGTIWSATPDGKLDHLADGRSVALRRPVQGRLADDWLEGIHPDDRERVRLRWRASLESGEPYEATLRGLLADGTYRWHLARGLPQRDEAGTIVRWVGVSIDIDDRVRADDEREKFVGLAEKSGDIVGIADRAGLVVYANPAALAFLEASREQLEGKPFLEWFVPEDGAVVSSTIGEALEREGRWAGEYRFRSFRTGRALPIVCEAFTIADSSGAVSGFATTSRDLRERQRIDIGMRALADAGKAMHESLDFAATMQNIANAVVTAFANMCSVEVANADGTIRTTTLATRDPRDAPGARQAALTRNAGIPPGHPIYRAIERGESTLKRILEPPFLASTGLDRHVGNKRGQLDLCSVIFVPVRSARDGRVLAVLSCGMGSSDPRGTYSEGDVRFAEEIAARAGLAFDNAHAYERTRRVAVEMQAASLPASLPQTPHLQLHAEYRPATDEAAIGGDWYDAFLLPDGRVAVTIGDVVGHGLRAAIWMTKMRQAMQVAAMLDPDPRVMLGIANRTLRMLEGEVYATAVAAIYDGTSGMLSLASAGHPPVAVARAGGSVEDLVCPGFLLGVYDDAAYEVRSVRLHANDLTVLYTDGLVEAGRDLTRGFERLRATLRLDAVRRAENPALAIFETMLSGAAIADDVAILTLRKTSHAARLTTNS